jgi:MSHA pilin protein MshC
VIMGILLAVVTPNFSDTQVFSERGYTDELASTLRYGQRIAMATQCPVRVTVNAASYNAFQQAGATCTGAWTVAVRRADGTNLAGSPASGVALAPAATTLTFYPDGTVSNAAAFTIGANFTVSVDGVNGAVTVQP